MSHTWIYSDTLLEAINMDHVAHVVFDFWEAGTPSVDRVLRSAIVILSSGERLTVDPETAAAIRTWLLTAAKDSSP